MSFLGFDTNIDDIPEITLNPVGVDVQMAIKKVILKESKNTPGLWMLNVTFTNVQEPDNSAVFENLCIPNENTQPNVERMWKKNLTGLCQAFDIEMNADAQQKVETENGIEIVDWVGKTGWVVLKLGKDQSGENINQIERYVVRS